MTSTIVPSKDLHKIDPVFGQSSFDDHEQIVFCHDKDTGLRAIIGIHSTILGPSLGGTRMWQYQNEWEALNDVLRLSRGMTFKAAITGLDLGGGKAVIIGDAKTQKTPEMIQRFGEFVGSLSGRYITAEDVGTTTDDMDIIRSVTSSVAGVSVQNGGSGNPSPSTAFGVYMGMKAAAQFRYGSDSLAGKKILVEGVGHVGEVLVKLISDEGAIVSISDINQERLAQVARSYNATILDSRHARQANVDIYAPCALGASINDDTVFEINAQIIAGAANNQLANENRHGQILTNRGILYAPDFLINAGGIINIAREVLGFSQVQAQQKLEEIYNTALTIFGAAKQQNCTTQEAAMQMAKARIDKKSKENNHK